MTKARPYTICVECGCMWQPAPALRNTPCTMCRKNVATAKVKVKGIREEQPKCAKWGKLCYTKKQAISAAHRVQRFGRGTMRVYHCTDCNQWHLTKRT